MLNQSSRENLIAALAGSDFETPIVGPRGDHFHHIQSVDVLQGRDDYETTCVAHISDNDLQISNDKIKTPNRPRTMGGIVITFWSEEYYLWSRQYLFHKGMIYESDNILKEDYDIEDKKVVEEDLQLSLL